MKLWRSAQPLMGAAMVALGMASAVSLPARAQNALTAAQWREDLKSLADRIPRSHRNAFHSISQASFLAAVADIDRRIPSLSDHEVMVAFARLVAMLGDGHSRVSLPGLTDPMSDR